MSLNMVNGGRAVLGIDGDRKKALDKVRPTAARNIARKPWLSDMLGVEHAEVVKQVPGSCKFYQHLDLTAEHAG